MYSSNQQPTQASSTSTETRHASTATSQQSQPQYSSSQAPQSSSYGTSAASASASQPKHQQTRATAQEPYPTQESTWWEEGVSPHPSRAEQGYGPGPSGQRQGTVGQTDNRNMYGAGQDQSGQYGQKRAHDDGVVNWNKVAKIVCAVLLPPLGVFLETGCDKSFLINVLLTILGYIPGIIHAIYVITTD